MNGTAEVFQTAEGEWDVYLGDRLEGVYATWDQAMDAAREIDQQWESGADEEDDPWRI